MFNKIGTLINTKLFGKRIGKDNFGNVYYVSKNNKQKKRWVIYFNNNDASSIPPEWQGWLTHTIKDSPILKKANKYKWQIAHKPNLTGSKSIYDIDNTELRNSSNIYSAWNPKKGKIID